MEADEKRVVSTAVLGICARGRVWIRQTEWVAAVPISRSTRQYLYVQLPYHLQDSGFTQTKHYCRGARK
jgi:hypothetical protein